ncbi:MAG: hypothetical protein IJ814_01695 [Paludibacteraceae bacterium]|nr:hypothetical protein [Paludibacteraceae bacterium]
MKKKSLFAMAAAALMLSACSEKSAQLNAPENPNGEVAVAFNASAQQNAQSPRPRRAPGATKTGLINDLDALKADGKQQFGVFAYYTEAGDFDGNTTTGSTPNFMYNQLVQWDGAAWGYSPVKYWPNEWAATVEAGHTAGTPSDKLSFFAYAPYIATADLPADPATATGIIGISANDAHGAPVLTYRAETTGTGVDLLWGVANTDYTSNATAAAKIVDAGFAFKDLVKPTTDAKIPFHFRHALAMFGATVQVYEQSGETFDATNTKVMIKEVELISGDGTSPIFYTYGKLSLDNTTANEPLWSDQSGDITSYNFASTDINTDLLYVASGYDAQTGAGVTTVKKNLTNAANGALFVPGTTGNGFKVRVKYAVITKDAALDGGYSEIENDITSDEISAFTMTAGTTSILNIKLGLHEVKVNVESVQAWGVQDEGDQTDVILSEGSATPAVTTYGPFTVAAGTTVKFSKGNLQYDIDNSKWQFAADQFTFIGNAVGNNSMTSGVIDLFGWGVAATDPAKATTTNSDYLNSVTADGAEMGSANDWGAVAAADLGGTWRTMTSAEWTYLLTGRSTTSGVYYAKATVNSVTGLIILPDDWSTSYHALTSTNTTSAAFNSNTISASDWASDFEAHNAVFLPAAGYRNGTSVSYVGTSGYYWSSTSKSSDYAFRLYFNGSSLNPASNNDRYDGRSVRLVQE